MSNSIRPSTSYQTQKPSLTDDDVDHGNNNQKYFVTRSFTLDNGPTKHQQRTVKSSLPSPTISDQKPRLSRSLLSNDNWREETMGDVRVNAKAIEQSDRNILFGKGEIELKN
jgi:hypothetical protein